MFVCSIKWLFNHILNTVCRFGVLNKGSVGLEKVQGVKIIKDKEWLLDESYSQGQYLLV